MTTKERLHQLVDELSEAEAGETLRFAAARHEGSNVDEWGDLDAHMDTAMLEALRDIDEEERAAGFSWTHHLARPCQDVQGLPRAQLRHKLLKSLTPL